MTIRQSVQYKPIDCSYALLIALYWISGLCVNYIPAKSILALMMDALHGVLSLNVMKLRLKSLIAHSNSNRFDARNIVEYQLSASLDGVSISKADHDPVSHTHIICVLTMMIAQKKRKIYFEKNSKQNYIFNCMFLLTIPEWILCTTTTFVYQLRYTCFHRNILCR